LERGKSTLGPRLGKTGRVHHPLSSVADDGREPKVGTLSSQSLPLPTLSRDIATSVAPPGIAGGTGGFGSIDAATVAAISDTAYLRSFGGGMYRDLDIEGTLDYMRRRFVAPLSRHVEIKDATLLDCASGFGWLSFAYLLSGGGRAILVDMDRQRLEAAREIATRLRVVGRCEFREARLQDIALGDDSVDIFASIETLEHVGRENIAACVATMTRLAKRAVLLTTPNFIFPMVAHDTGLPFAHWLPGALRRRYAKAAGRANMDHANQFLMPWDLKPLAAKFRPATAYQTFDRLAEFDDFFPHYMPYGNEEKRRHRAAPKAGQRAMLALLGKLLGPYSFTLAPNLASLWVRRSGTGVP
jgi:ubiquinone/menaquinone biosynthesis C-methylase UbiE